LKTHLRSSAGSDDAPLLYPGHFAGGILAWPRTDFKKPNGIEINDATQRWLFTAFPKRSVMAKYLAEIAWETEVWVADSPTHLIHFNGHRFLGPYDAET